ncbi:MAG: hypothetical protein M1829_000838 [Trizodia sp. TS-e1964]|nr:MAG: hypothetical protein M1829_000838 [Trizodia sp. TS-e1964]
MHFSITLLTAFALGTFTTASPFSLPISQHSNAGKPAGVQQPTTLDPRSTSLSRNQFSDIVLKGDREFAPQSLENSDLPSDNGQYVAILFKIGYKLAEDGGSFKISSPGLHLRVYEQGDRGWSADIKQYDHPRFRTPGKEGYIRGSEAVEWYLFRREGVVSTASGYEAIGIIHFDRIDEYSPTLDELELPAKTLDTIKPEARLAAREKWCQEAVDALQAKSMIQMIEKA